MDVEIVKSNGQKFRLSDYGVVQDFVVNSIDRSVTRESVDGRKGSVDYGTNIGDRSISVPMIFKASDLHDYAHLRDELFGILDDDEPFYIREMRRKDYLQYEFVDFGQSPTWSNGVENEYVNGKQYKVRLDSSISPEQWDDKPNGDITIEFVTSGLPFAETIYTTLELHDSGYSSTAEKYGLVDNIDDEKVQYRYIPETDYQPNLISLTQSAWEVGNWYTTNGTAGSQTGNVRTKSGQIPVVKGEKYTLKDSSVYSSSVRAIFILHYNNGVYIGSTGGWEVVNRGGNTTFTAKGNEIRISIAPMEGFSVLLEFITNGRVQLKLEPGEEHTGFIPAASRFSVYNAGNVTVEPESMQITFNFTGVYTTGGFTIRNLTTGEEVILNRSSNGSHFKMDGMLFSLGAINNVFRDTNRRFISLAPGDNQFEIVGGTFSQCWFDFKYYYR